MKPAFAPSLAIFALTACPSSVVQGRTPTSTTRPIDRDPATYDHGSLDRILMENVRDGRVDYLAVRKNHWNDLVAYLDRIALFEPQRLPRDEQLALYINLYNATLISAVIRRLRADYSPAEGSFKVFDEPLVRVDGGTVSLNDLENKIIRPRFRDPRIHAALVCGARSCPPLLPRAYRGEDLDQKLEANMRSFVNDPSRNRIDPERRRLELSQIFNWYAEDFGGSERRLRFLDRYHEADLSGLDESLYLVSFIKYSWELNIAPPQAGRWVQVTSRTASLRGRPGGEVTIATVGEGEVFEVMEERNGSLHIHHPLAGVTAWIEIGATAPYQPTG